MATVSIPSMALNVVCLTCKNFCLMRVSGVNSTSLSARAKLTRFSPLAQKTVAQSSKRLQEFSSIASVKKRLNAGWKQLKSTCCACKTSFVKYVASCAHLSARQKPPVATVKLSENFAHCVCSCQVGKLHHCVLALRHLPAKSLLVIQARKRFVRNLLPWIQKYWQLKLNYRRAVNPVSMTN